MNDLFGHTLNGSIAAIINNIFGFSSGSGLYLVFGLSFEGLPIGFIDLLGHFDEIGHCVHAKYEGAALAPFVQVFGQAELNGRLEGRQPTPLNGAN